jgi:hypothetical protein
MTKISRKDAKAQSLRQRKQNSREKAQNVQKESRVFRGTAVSDLPIQQLIPRQRADPF